MAAFDPGAHGRLVDTGKLGVGGCLQSHDDALCPVPFTAANEAELNILVWKSSRLCLVHPDTMHNPFAAVLSKPSTALRRHVCFLSNCGAHAAWRRAYLQDWASEDIRGMKPGSGSVQSLIQTSRCSEM